MGTAGRVTVSGTALVQETGISIVVMVLKIVPIMGLSWVIMPALKAKAVRHIQTLPHLIAHRNISPDSAQTGHLLTFMEVRSY
jgi:hypothetical protein